jgi:hypothetical protein
MFQYQAIQTGQVSVPTAATQIVGQYSSRSGLVLTNTGSVTVYIGENSGVTTSTGYPLAASASVSFSTTGAVYGITGSSEATIGWLQTN